MTFLRLFDKLGKQPVKNTRTSEVVAVLNYEDLKELLRKKKPTYTVPLELKFGNGKHKMWFIKGERHENKNGIV